MVRKSSKGFAALIAIHLPGPLCSSWKKTLAYGSDINVRTAQIQCATYFADDLVATITSMKVAGRLKFSSPWSNLRTKWRALFCKVSCRQWENVWFWTSVKASRIKFCTISHRSLQWTLRFQTTDTNQLFLLLRILNNKKARGKSCCSLP